MNSAERPKSKSSGKGKPKEKINRRKGFMIPGIVNFKRRETVDVSQKQMDEMENKRLLEERMNKMDYEESIQELEDEESKKDEIVMEEEFEEEVVEEKKKTLEWNYVSILPVIPVTPP